jgi:hypothetical protein
MSTIEYDPKESVKILKKQFILQEEFFILVGRKCVGNQQMFNEIKKCIKKDLESKGKSLPDSRHLPLGLVLEYLKDYGITRESILESATLSY